MKDVTSSLFTTGMNFIKELVKMTTCFPEIINRIYMLNAPVSFTIAWSAIKMLMAPRTIQKTGFFSNFSKAKEDLLSYIDADELLSDYGGTGPSFQTVLESRQEEFDGHVRYVVEIMKPNSKGTSFDFTINEQERIHSVVVYSKAAGEGATFAVTKEGNQKMIVGDATVVNRSKNSGCDTRKHYSVALNLSNTNNNASPTSRNFGNYTIEAKSSKKYSGDPYLVAIAVDKI
jgi:hypothetical protein